ncbi:hypothetical protein ABR776_18195 [Bacillus cereus]|uniref:SMODS-associated NUDIX domain-containing protein n=1 Tax=Bacillus cereus group TaxID=86661 RepID=UPI00086CD1B7|nr:MULTISPECIES: hypothetical protein [Bacillus cereus group]SCN43379.1 Uncharacterized protein BC067498_01218 [Bacillus cereus]HDR4725978.1 hypothetical protein [Bacillus cereus]HDX9551140.1 hypothetical protein [Bacillus thuringiensis]
MNLIFYLAPLFLLICTLSLFFTSDGTIVSLLTSAIITVAYGIVSYFLNNSRSLKNIYLSLITKTKYRNEHIRFSISYLFKIKVGSDYLLVKGNRINQYQPIGGVYKFYPGVTDSFKKWDIKDDDCILIDDHSKNDLRIRVPGKHVMDFLNWFENRTSREVSANREFIEELIDTDILPLQHFHKLNYQFVKQIQNPLVYEQRFGCYQILIADIYELILDEEQENQFKSLKSTSSEKYLWANEELIKKLGVVKKEHETKNISPTSEWIL